jgi:hypothetical protein
METTTTIHMYQSAVETVPIPKKMLWTGRIISAMPILVLIMSAIMKL